MAEKEYIEREAARAQLIINDELHAADLIKSIPAADVRPVVHGKWKFDDFDGDGFDYQCSACEQYSRSNYDFCPHCGADMRRADNG